MRDRGLDRIDRSGLRRRILPNVCGIARGRAVGMGWHRHGDRRLGSHRVARDDLRAAGTRQNGPGQEAEAEERDSASR